MKIFKGYIGLNGKAPAKKAPILKQLSPDFEQFEDAAGVLEDNIVVLDFDDGKAAGIVLDIIKDRGIKCRAVKTSRGAHFYFRNNGEFTKNQNGAKIALTLEADIKTGWGEKTAYVKVKQGGEKREILLDYADLDTAPKWLMPVSSRFSFFGMKEGDGRDNDLFQYIIPLKTHGFSKDEIRETISLINWNLLDKPLSKADLDRITRDEAIDNIKPDFMHNKKFDCSEFADYLIEQLHIKRIRGEIHFFEGRIYKSGDLNLEHEMLKIVNNLSKRHRTEVLNFIKARIPENNEDLPDCSNLIAFKNGVFNLDTEQMQTFSSDYIITNLINWNYNPNAVCPAVDAMLDKISCNDDEVRRLLEELIGYCFYRSNRRAAFILTGDGSNGKSTFLDVLNVILGDTNVANLDFCELNERFSIAELAGKLANIGDDINDKFIDDLSKFKKLVTGERVKGERKGQDPFMFNSYAKFIFSANTLPRLKDDTGAGLSRLIIVPFNATFSPKDPDFDPMIGLKLIKPDAIERFIYLGVQGLLDVLDYGFTKCGKADEIRHEYNILNNPVLSFLDGKTDEDLCRETIPYWYGQYKEYCFTNGLRSESNITFTKKVLRNRHKLARARKVIQGKEYKIFKLADKA